MNGPRTEAGPWPRARTTAASRAVSCSSARPARRAGRGTRPGWRPARRGRRARRRPGREALVLHQGPAAPRAPRGARQPRALLERRDEVGDHRAPRRVGRQHEGGTPRSPAGGSRHTTPAHPRGPRPGAPGQRSAHRARRAPPRRGGEGRHRPLQVGRGRQRRAPASDGTSARSASARPAGAAAPVLVRVVTAPRMGDDSAGFKRPASQRARFIHRAKRRVRRLAPRHKAAERGPRI